MQFLFWLDLGHSFPQCAAPYCAFQGLKSVRKCFLSTCLVAAFANRGAGALPPNATEARSGYAVGPKCSEIANDQSKSKEMVRDSTQYLAFASLAFSVSVLTGAGELPAAHLEHSPPATRSTATSQDLEKHQPTPPNQFIQLQELVSTLMADYISVDSLSAANARETRVTMGFKPLDSVSSNTQTKPGP